MNRRPAEPRSLGAGFAAALGVRLGAGQAVLLTAAQTVLLATACATPDAAPPGALRTEARDANQSAHTAAERRAWPAAAERFGAAAELFAALGDAEAEAPARREEAQARRRAAEPALAVSADQRALLLDQHLGLREAQAADLAGLARSAAAQGRTDDAIATVEEARALATPGSAVAAVVDNDLALYLVVRGREEDRARVDQLLAAALASNEARADARGIATNQLNRGRAALVFGAPDLAEDPLQDALTRFRALEDPDGLAFTNELLAQLYTAQGDPARAHFHEAQARAGFAVLRAYGP